MSHNNTLEGKHGDSMHLPTAPGETMELVVAAEDGYRSTTSATRRMIFSKLQEEKATLEARKAEMDSHLDLANRRLEAHNRMRSAAELPSSDPCYWLSDPKDIARMRDRLKKASQDEQLILPIVEEVREVRERLLEQALVVYRDLAAGKENT